MYTKVLLAMDRSEQSLAAFNTALVLAQKFDAHLLIMSAVELSFPADLTGINATYYAQALQEVQEEAIKSSKTFLEDFKSKAQRAGIEAMLICHEGAPGPLICSEARFHECDLIVVGRRGLGGLQEMFLGSVSNYVLHHAPCAVLIVQGAKKSVAVAES